MHVPSMFDSPKQFRKSMCVTCVVCASAVNSTLCRGAIYGLEVLFTAWGLFLQNSALI